MKGERFRSCLSSAACVKKPDGFTSVASRLTSSDLTRSKLQDAWFGICADLRLDGPTYAWLDAAFHVTDKLSRASVLSQIPTPILIGSAGEDLLVDERAHLHAASLLQRCRLALFSTAKHELFHETDDIRGRWFAAIDAFTTEHIRSS